MRRFGEGGIGTFVLILISEYPALGPATPSGFPSPASTPASRCCWTTAPRIVSAPHPPWGVRRGKRRRASDAFTPHFFLVYCLLIHSLSFKDCCLNSHTSFLYTPVMWTNIDAIAVMYVHTKNQTVSWDPAVRDSLEKITKRFRCIYPHAFNFISS